MFLPGPPFGCGGGRSGGAPPASLLRSGTRRSRCLSSICFGGRKRNSFPLGCFAVFGEPDALRRVDLEKLEHPVCLSPVKLCDSIFVFLRRHRAEDEIAMGLHLHFLQHCKSAISNSQHMKHPKYKKKVKAHRRTQKYSQSEVKPKAFVQSGHGMPPMSSAQASSARTQPSTSGHTEMLRYSSTISRVLYLRANWRSIITNSSPSGQEGFFA
jgi:hypothetical protein